ncbi:MAG: peptidoglycan-binding domain-containing protein [Minisyncoccota bacterium]
MKSRTRERRNSPAWGFLSFIFIVSISIGASTAHASTTSGTINTATRYAWSNVGGWVNFAVASTTGTSDQVTVTDSALTGYAWSANDGWINLNPTNCGNSTCGVKNDGAGNLSGYAWDAGAGWVNFSGVKINSSGKFTGTAAGGTVLGAIYQINFDCAHCDVETDWRPASSRTTTTTTVASNGSISPVYFPPPASPGPTLSVTEQTATSSVSVSHASGLTSSQIQSILSLLTSFNVDAARIANVQAILSGGTPAPRSFSFTRNLSLNQTSADVEALQQFLNTHGFTVATKGPGSPGHETTKFGSQTRAALIRFQKSEGLPATGWFGPMTRGKIAGL